MFTAARRPLWTIYPSDEDTGIIFQRIAMEGARDVEIKAEWSRISATALCTVLGDPEGAYVSTVEHLLAALRAMGVDNAVIEVDGPEVPIMDGSSAAFIDAIESVGLTVQKKRRKVLRILKPVRVDAGDRVRRASPARWLPVSRSASITITTASATRPCISICVVMPSVRISPRARTFGFLKDVEHLWANNFALGSSLENAVVLGDEGIVNPEGARWADEFVRHKILDAIGDLSLAGMPIEGCYRSHKGGHRLNFTMMKALFDDPSNYEIVDDAARRDGVRSERTADEVNVRLEAATLRPETN